MRPIHIHTVVDDHTWGYFNEMQSSLWTLASHPDGLFCHTYHVDRGTSSRGHAAGLREALQRCVPGVVHLLADSDTVVLMRGWDDWLRAALSPGRLDVVGVGYDEVGSFSCGWGRSQTQKSCPNPTWMAFDGASAPWHEFDPSREDTELSIDDPTTARLYGLNVGHTLLRDVGWQLPEFLYVHDLRSLRLPRRRQVLQELSEYHEEFHTDGDPGVPLVAHQRGSSKHEFMSEPHSKAFYEAVRRHVEAEAAPRPRQEDT